MKKISLYLMALLTLGLVACDKDYITEVGPQTNGQEDIVKLANVTMTTGQQTINIAELINGDNGEQDINIGTLKLSQPLPADSYLEADVELSLNADYSDAITVKALDIDSTYQINLRPSTLQDAYFNGITRNPATQQLYVRTIVYIITGGESVATIGDQNGIKYFDPHTVTFTPLFKVKISPAYYIVGGPNSDWAGSAAAKAIKFNHSDLDVYEDPIFTVTFDAAASGDTWFAIGDDEACAAVGSGDWSQLLGIVGGDNEAKEGKLDTRANMGADNSFKVAEGAKKIKVTLDMMNYTFKVEPVSIADAYYLVGGPGSWSSDKSQKFSHSSLSVFEDPVFTYTFAGNGGTGDIWFAFGDAAALDAIDSGDWMQLYGYVGEMAEQGSFDRRSNLGAENTFHVDGKAKYYRFTVNMNEMTYEIKALSFEEFIYVPGNAQKFNTSAAGMPDYGWTPGLAPALRSPGSDGLYTGYAYMDGEFKFTKARDWDHGEYNYDSFTVYDGIFTGNAGSGGNINCTEAGYYQLVADVANGSLKATKLTWGLVGPATVGGWDAPSYTVMNYNMADDCWEITTTLAAGEFKFTANGSWDINLGGTLDDLSEGGNNLRIDVAGEYNIKLYPSRSQSDKMYAVVNKVN